MREFSWPVRVYYEDTDAGGVVYYANYLKFMERARTEWLRCLGYEQTELSERQNMLLVVQSVSVKYLKPAYLNDSLRVVAGIDELKRSSMLFSHRVIRLEHDMAGELLATGNVRVVCVDASSFRPKPIPELMLEEFKSECWPMLACWFSLCWEY